MKKMFFFFPLFLGLAFSNLMAQTQLNSFKTSGDDLPSQIKVKGVVNMARSWNDKNGDNYFVVGITEPTEGKEGGKTIRLHAVHYAGQPDNLKLMREFNDFIDDCQLDFDLSPIEGSLSITDIDNDGKGEVMFLYRLGCYGDVSPLEVKLMMTENGDKYAIRGTETMYLGKEKTGGEKTIGAELNNNAAFKKLASAHWDKFCPNIKM
ncbi:MAG: M949_RS01915 family surface polysaccharide biosynthesis protein [Bacteroidia bacterium]